MKYTEEEKQAIEVVSNLRCYYNDESLLNEDELEENKINNNSIDLVLKLLDKQQKEIERLKEYLNQYYDGKLFTSNQLRRIEKEHNKYYIHKDKIREKIKDLRYNESLGFEQSFEETFKIEVLEELLGE